MNETDFLSYFPNVGRTFQPDSNETTSITNKLSLLARQQTSVEDFVLLSLGDLGLFYANISGLNATKLKAYGANLIDTVKSNRDPDDAAVQACRFGLENDLSVLASIESVQDSFVTAYVSSLNSRRRRRSVKSTLTCDDLNNLSGSLSSLSASQLNVEDSVFVACQQLLGSASNGWSSEQLASLVAVAKSVYPTGLVSLSDANIASLNSILLGYSSSELAQLNFGQLSSISALGALSAWTADQVSCF